MNKLLLSLIAVALGTANLRAAELYVSASGKDAWSGTLAAPNADNTDGPLATLQGARDRIRAMKKHGPLPAGGVSVVLSGGTYFLSKTVELGQADSGTAESPIVYRAAEGEKVQIIGGRPITGFVPYQGSILKADVAGQGFKGIYFRQLFFDGKRQPLARYPNFAPQNPHGGGWAYADGRPIPMNKDIPNESRRTFQYKDENPRNWSRPEEGEVFVFPRYNWFNNILRIKSIDRQTRIITLVGDATYPIRPGDRYYVQNLLEELDSPGEWYLDRRTETLYFWPPASPDGKTVYAPTMRSLIVIGPGTSHVTIRGLTLECCEGTAVMLSNTDDCLIVGNTIRNVGDFHGDGVLVHSGHRNGVVGNDIFEVGADGIKITGGDRKTLTPAENYADNNYIHHTGVACVQNGVGIELTGVGNRATHNLIHDCPRFGIMFFGNNIAVQYNHIRHVATDTSDTGAIYTGGRNWTDSRGSRICYNYIHDSIGFGQKDGVHDSFGFGRQDGKWQSPYFAWGIYLDDNTGGVDVIGNIVVRGVRGLIHLHNGRDNLIENNIFVGGSLQQIEFNGWMSSWSSWKRFLPEMTKGYNSVAGQPAWSKMRNMDIRPADAAFPNGMIMSGNVTRHNIFYYSDPKSQLFKLRNVPLDRNKFDYNLVYHSNQPLKNVSDPFPPIKSTVPKAKLKSAATSNLVADTPTDCWPVWWRAQGEDQHSIVADPKFVDPAKDDYRLRPDSPARKLGFKPIPIEKIGPYADPLRASWPIVEAEGVREKPLVSEK
jgi:hypothetical protein